MEKITKKYSVSVSFRNANHPFTLTYRVGRRFNDEKKCIPIMRKVQEKLKKDYHFTPDIISDTDSLTIGDCGEMSVMIYIHDDKVVNISSLDSVFQKAPDALNKLNEKMQQL